MIISKKKYDLMCSLINKQRETINLLEEQTNLLKRILRKSNLSNIYGSTHCNNIDFPNSEKSYEDRLF